MFQPNEHLKEAVKSKNLDSIYNEFFVIAHEDPSFSSGKFMETLSYVKAQNILGFIKPFDGRRLEETENWDEDYWALLVSSLVDNFSMERIEHLEQVSRHLYAKEIEPQGLKNKHSGPRIEVYSPRKEKQSSSKKVLPVAVAGLAITSLVALAAGKKTLGAISALAAIGIGIYAVINKES